MRKAITLFDHLRGLMFDNTPNAEMEFVFHRPTREGASIHTLFMNYPVHVQWLDEDRKVIEERDMKPWIINYTPKQPAKYIIEKRIGE